MPEPDISPSIIQGFPPVVAALQQRGLLQRALHDGLFPALMFRAEALREEWQGQTGTSITMTRPGLLPPITTPAVAGRDPDAQQETYEQWTAHLQRYNGSIPVHVPTSAHAAISLFVSKVNLLGLQAGQSLNRLPRNKLYKTYLSGQTVTIAAALSGDTSIQVASLSGFRDVLTGAGTNIAPAAVSATTPLSIAITNAPTITRNVIGVQPLVPDDPDGPGILVLDAALGAAVAARTPVLAENRPRIIRSGGGNSVDAIGPNDTFVLQDAIAATNWLRRNNVPPHEDGLYHAHISADGNEQVFTDEVFQRLNTALPDGVRYQEAFIGKIAGLAFFFNNETPSWDNSGRRTATGSSAQYSENIAAETVNEGGVSIARMVVTGRGSIYEQVFDQANYVTEAGITGRIGEFNVTYGGMQVSTDDVRVIFRAPQNKTMDLMDVTWDITTSFTCPSDVRTGGPQRYKRAVVIEHAMTSG